MSDLDDKIRSIIMSDYDVAETDDVVARIKQAFADEGYVTPENAKKVQEMVNQMAQLAQDSFNMPTMVNVRLDKKQQTMQKLMTGQEWSDRFDKNLHLQPIPNRWMECYDVGAIWGIALEAAKRAAGRDPDS